VHAAEFANVLKCQIDTKEQYGASGKLLAELEEVPEEKKKVGRPKKK